MRLASQVVLLLFFLGLASLPVHSATGSKQSDPTLIALQGLVRVNRRVNGPQVSPVVRSMLLGAGYVLATGTNGLADMLFPNGWNAKTAADTVVQISSPVPDRLVTTRGKVWLRVPHGLHASIEGPAARAAQHHQ